MVAKIGKNTDHNCAGAGSRRMAKM
jgi:hypothetical protein